MKKDTTKKLMFLFVFMALVFIGDRINFSKVIGAENQFFTLFQFFGPIAGGFLGPLLGVVSVLGAQLGSFLLLGKAFSVLNLLRLLPMLFAAYYFGTKKKYIGVIVPVIAMALFILHPVGRQAWFYCLYWLIPILGVVLPKKVPGRLFFRSLGATFTAHAVGSVIFLYTVPMEAAQWIGLIPVVAYERLLFASGIAISYVVLNTVLDRLKVPEKFIHVDKSYVLRLG
ncbi:hypothetical protein JXA85_05590 [Candidatus Woesearchaeota archaeon]|nr:hypothetical protein [Candidatus Woesearchaeota archaeon]